MIKATKIEVEHVSEQGITTARVDLYADTKEEILALNVNDTKDVFQLPDHSKITAGSTVYTKQLDIGILDSAGEWTI